MRNDFTNLETKVIETILKWAHMAKHSKRIEYADNGTTFSIPYKDFNLINDFRMGKFLADFFDELKENGCFENWTTNPYKKSGNEEYIVHKVNSTKLEELITTTLKKNHNNFKLPDPKKWNPDEKRKYGEYKISEDIKITFRGSRFGGINELMKNVDYEISKDQLTKAIARSKQGESKRSSEINVSNWKNQVKFRVPLFKDYFEIISPRPKYYRLILKDS